MTVTGGGFVNSVDLRCRWAFDDEDAIVLRDAGGAPLAALEVLRQTLAALVSRPPPELCRAWARCGEAQSGVEEALRSDGALSGYRWGVERKRALIEREKSTRKK